MTYPVIEIAITSFGSPMPHTPLSYPGLKKTTIGRGLFELYQNTHAFFWTPLVDGNPSLSIFLLLRETAILIKLVFPLHLFISVIAIRETVEIIHSCGRPSYKKLSRRLLERGPHPFLA